MIPFVELPATVPLLTEFSMILLECRRRDMEFERAWNHANQVLKIERHNMDDSTKTEIREWRKALAWGKEHFEAAYCSPSLTQSDRRAPSLADAHRASQSSGDDVRDAAQRKNASSRQIASHRV